MPSIFQALAEIERNQQAGALCMVVRSQGSTPRHTSSKMIVFPDGQIIGTIGGGEVERRVIEEAKQAIQDGNPRILTYNMVDPARGDPGVCGGQLEVYVEPILPKPMIAVLGAGHVGKALAALAHWLGFRVAVWDDRADLCNPDNIPDADQYLVCPIQELADKLVFTSQSYLVLTTRGADLDVEGLPRLLDKPAAYIGVIGSRRRWALTKKKLLEKGVSEELLQRVTSPIGLELNAETPEEIAVSIMAEIIMLRNGGHGGRMQMNQA
ncbi:MAG: XdhC family protein [Anaerolineales bacterium]